MNTLKMNPVIVNYKSMLKIAFIVKHVILKIQDKISIGLHHKVEKVLHTMECEPLQFLFDYFILALYILRSFVLISINKQAKLNFVFLSNKKPLSYSSLSMINLSSYCDFPTLDIIFLFPLIV